MYVCIYVYIILYVIINIIVIITLVTTVVQLTVEELREHCVMAVLHSVYHWPANVDIINGQVGAPTT